MIGLDYIDDGLHNGGRREEFAAVVRSLFGELGKEILVDAPEHVAGRSAHGLSVKRTQHTVQYFVIEPSVVLWELAGQRREVLLDGLHSSVDLRSDIGTLFQLQERVVPCLLGQHHRTAASEVCLDQGALRHPTCGLISLNGLQCLIVAVAGVP